ncbi:MAG: response regulator [Gemmatimonadales bacterium]|nr:response regulator [Gemmatimonadales bacterium]
MSAASPARLILVVDDEPGVRRLACQMLEREGYGTLEAEDGREALALLSADASRIALVLTDVRMPHLNGMQLEQAIRDIWPRLPVIVMSGEVTREWLTRLARERLLRMLRKPFDAGDLLDTVRELLVNSEGEEPQVGK